MFIVLPEDTLEDIEATARFAERHCGTNQRLFFVDLATTKDTRMYDRLGLIWDPRPIRANGHYMRVLPFFESPMAVLKCSEDGYLRGYSRRKTIMRGVIQFLAFWAYLLYPRPLTRQMMKEIPWSKPHLKVWAWLRWTVIEASFPVLLRWGALDKARRFFRSPDYRVHKRELAKYLGLRIVPRITKLKKLKHKEHRHINS